METTCYVSPPECNSLRVRLETLVPWLTQDGPDVVCLQETKVTDDLFSYAGPRRPGVSSVFTGQKTTMA